LKATIRRYGWRSADGSPPVSRCYAHAERSHPAPSD
jgi:hypothetical protein